MSFASSYHYEKVFLKHSGSTELEGALNIGILIPDIRKGSIAFCLQVAKELLLEGMA